MSLPLVPVWATLIPSSKPHVRFPLLRSFQRIRPSPRPCVTICNLLVFYREKLFAPRSTPKLECHHLSAVLNCLLNIFTACLHVWRSSSPPSTWERAMSWWREPLNLKFGHTVAIVCCCEIYVGVGAGTSLVIGGSVDDDDDDDDYYYYFA